MKKPLGGRAFWVHPLWFRYSPCHLCSLQRTVLQGLKPAQGNGGICGTAKAMPCYKATTPPSHSMKRLSKLDIHLPKVLEGSHPFARNTKCRSPFDCAQGRLSTPSAAADFAQDDRAGSFSFDTVFTLRTCAGEMCRLIPHWYHRDELLPGYLCPDCGNVFGSRPW
jgi:hypothetical protein